MTIIKYIAYFSFASLFIFYLVYTAKYAIDFKRNKLFTGRRKLFHSIMIWIFPFCWILLLKSFLKPIPGSSKFPNKFDSNDYRETGADNWSGGLG